MREVSRLPRRVVGREALIRRLTGNLLAAHRYGRHRARTRDEVQWSAHLIDRLQTTLDEARRGEWAAHRARIEEAVMDPCFDERLQSTIEHLAYSFSARTARLYLPALCCVDMDRAIAFCRAIDPHVTRIETYAGPNADIVYVKTQGGWRVLCDQLDRLTTGTR